MRLKIKYRIAAALVIMIPAVVAPLAIDALVRYCVAPEKPTHVIEGILSLVTLIWVAWGVIGANMTIKGKFDQRLYPLAQAWEEFRHGKEGIVHDLYEPFAITKGFSEIKKEKTVKPNFPAK